MSGLNLVQVYAANPITSNTNTDLMYFVQSGVDAGMHFSDFAAQFPGKTGTGASGTWGINISGNAATASTASAVAVSAITGLGTGVSTALAINVGSAGAFVPTTGSGASGTWGISISGNASTAGTASSVALGGITGLGTGVATALAVNTGSAGAFVTFNGALGTPSSGTATNLTGTASSLTAGQASALVGNTPSYLSNASIGNSVGGSSGNYQMGAAHITLTQGTWRVKMYAVMNFGASTIGCSVAYNSGFYGADGANNNTPPTAISSTTTGPITYNALSGGGTYNPMPNQTATGNYILFPLECYITVASGTQAVYAVLSVGWSTSTTLSWGSFIEGYKVSN